MKAHNNKRRRVKDEEVHSDSSDGSAYSYSSRNSSIEEEEYSGDSSSGEGQSSRTKPLHATAKPISSASKIIDTEERSKNIPLSKRRARQGKADVRADDEIKEEEGGVSNSSLSANGLKAIKKERRASTSSNLNGDEDGVKVLPFNTHRHDDNDCNDVHFPPTDLLSLNVFDEMLCDEILSITFEIHRNHRTGKLCLNCNNMLPDIVNKSGYDIFGQTHSQLQVVESFECINCSRPVIASRFAPHLEKCMGLGRASSRIASRRMKEKGEKSEKSDKVDKAERVERSGDKDKSDRGGQQASLGTLHPAALNAKHIGSSDSESEHITGEGGNGQSLLDGDDWKPKEDKHRIRKPMLNSKPQVHRQHKRSRSSKMDNHDWTDIKVRSLLLTTCGVVSNATGKMCTKTLKCPQHNDQLRNELRMYVNIRVPDDPVPLLGNGLYEANMSMINNNFNNSNNITHYNNNNNPYNTDMYMTSDHPHDDDDDDDDNDDDDDDDDDDGDDGDDDEDEDSNSHMPEYEDLDIHEDPSNITTSPSNYYTTTSDNDNHFTENHIAIDHHHHAAAAAHDHSGFMDQYREIKIQNSDSNNDVNVCHDQNHQQYQYQPQPQQYKRRASSDSPLVDILGDDENMTSDSTSSTYKREGILKENTKTMKTE